MELESFPPPAMSGRLRRIQSGDVEFRSALGHRILDCAAVVPLPDNPIAQTLRVRACSDPRPERTLRRAALGCPTDHRLYQPAKGSKIRLV
jgi:hypothetical protein